MIVALFLTSLVLGVPGPAAPSAPDPVQAAGAAGVPTALARDVASRAGARGVAPERALAPVVAAARAGLPGEVVAAKILEGLAKGAPPERVLEVAAELGGRLSRAAALVAQARASGLPLRGDRTAALADLAGALGAGVPPDAVLQLVDAARGASGGSCEAVVAAARTLGELTRRGVPVRETLPLGAALAQRAPASAGEVAALYDAYRAEGGRDAAAFLVEAERRVQAGAALQGMVDTFGESPDHLVRARSRAADAAAGGLDKASEHVRSAREGVGPGSPPGLERVPPGRGPKKPK
ncbi:conserved hypothetical protein [Anaeromyxobacter sp. K]|uniref:hypothetical protein n=1 Tax=Anaeromyxobacter sp. (strain K) TaxID=447217 RepID=UPI00017BE3E7|nr:hypothetical protein [Anaeromyxobacter sp. K]ACG75007.1 conserved hypothetical protein [Anaeromyxobacter sp. K]